MADLKKRITSLTEKTTLTSGDFIAVDNDSGGTKKYNYYADKIALDQAVEDVDDLKDGLTQETEMDWFQGWYGASTGLMDVSQTAAIGSNKFSYGVLKISCISNYKFRLQAWDKSGYIGIWNGTQFVKSNPNYYLTEFNFSTFESAYPSYEYACVLYRQDGANITTEEGDNLAVVYNKGLYLSKMAYMTAQIQYSGESIAPQKHGIHVSYYDQTLPGPVSGTSSRQGGDAFNGTLYILCSNNKCLAVDLNKSTKKYDMDITCGHGNSCQFGKVVQSGEDTPRLYCFGYNDNKVYENSIIGSATTLEKTYALPIVGYRVSGGYDADRNRLVTIHYKNDSSTDAEGNYCTVSFWDLNNATQNEDTTYTPSLLKEYTTPFIGAIQDCKVYDNRLYVLSGLRTNTEYPSTIITVFGGSGVINSVVIDANAGNEPEELFVVEKEYNAYLYLGTSRIHVLQFTL